MLNFLDQLDEEQALNAEKVAKAAKRAGVDPQLAVAIAFQESRLRSNPPRGSSGEIGMMQVMPGTGRGMGYNEKQLSDLDQNIEAGVKYLKKGLEATENDPQLTAIYYNGGPGAIQAMMSGKDPDPRVYNYLRSINSYGAFAPKAEAQPEAPGAASAAAPAAEQPETDEERDARINAVIEAQERRMGQLYGAGVGAGVSAGRLGAEAVKGAARTMGRESEAGRIAARRGAGLPAGGAAPAAPAATPGAAPAARPAGGVPGGVSGGLPGAPVGPADGGYMARGQTGAQVYNTAKSIGLTDIEAARALDTTKQEGGAYDLQKKRREAMLDIRQRFPSETYVENPRFGGIMTQDQGVGSGPRASYVMDQPSAPGQPPQQGGLRALPARQAVPTAPPPPSALQTVTQELRAMARPVIAGAGAVGKYVVPPLALAGAGGEAADVYGELRKQDPDYIKAILSGITGVSGLAALAPPLTIPATAIGGSAAMINYLREQEKERARRGIVTPPPPSLDYAAP
jgi:hypothetical protein